MPVISTRPNSNRRIIRLVLLGIRMGIEIGMVIAGKRISQVEKIFLKNM